MKRWLLLALLLPSLLSCAREDRIVVGAKAFTEGYLLGHMAVMLLEEAGYEVEEQFGVASAAMRSALETGQVDLYFEYTGTAYTGYIHGTDRAVMTDSARVFQAVRDVDSVEHGLRWLAPLPFDDSYALLMRRADAARLRIATLGDLARAIDAGERLRIATDAEFYERPDGLKALFARYGISDAEVIKLDAGLGYQALVDGRVDVSMGYSTDGRIVAFDLVPLDDDLHFFPAYNPAAVVRIDRLQRTPGIDAALQRLNALLDNETIRRLNAEVDVHHRDPRKVARQWLIETGLISAR